MHRSLWLLISVTPTLLGACSGSDGEASCLPAGVYVAHVERSQDPGSCPEDAELPIEVSDVEVKPGDEVCGTSMQEHKGYSGNCSYEGEIETSISGEEVDGTATYRVSNCPEIADGAACSFNLDLHFAKRSEGAQD